MGRARHRRALCCDVSCAGGGLLDGLSTCGAPSAFLGCLEHHVRRLHCRNAADGMLHGDRDVSRVAHDESRAPEDRFVDARVACGKSRQCAATRSRLGIRCVCLYWRARSSAVFPSFVFMSVRAPILISMSIIAGLPKSMDAAYSSGVMPLPST